MAFLKGLWNGVKGVAGSFLKTIPIVGPIFGALGGLFNKNGNNGVFGAGAKDLENGSGGFLNSLTGAIPGLLSAGSTILLNNLSRNGDMKAQMQLMDYQNTLQGQNYERELADKKAMIEDDREYNSIGAQMARAEQAGVSPLAALGVSSGNSISATAPSHSGVSGHNVENNILGTISTLKGLEMQKRLNDAQVYRLEQAANLDKQKAETEQYNSIMRKLETESYPDEVKARIGEMVNRGDLAGAQKELVNAQTETETHKQSNLDAQSALANAQALKTKLEYEYEQKYNRTMSNGLSNVIDTFSDFIFGNGKWRERVLDATTNGRGLSGVLDDLFTEFMKIRPKAINDEVRKQLFDLLLKIFIQ